MDNFPQLDERAFVKCRRQYHAIAEILGKIREKLVKPIAKNDNLWLSVSEGGFSIPPIENLGSLEIGCNPKKRIIELDGTGITNRRIELSGKSRKDICDQLLASIGVANADLVGSSLEDLASDKIFEVSESDANDFQTQLTNYNSIFREFHKSITTGVRTQVCLWPHHFDNAFKWFSGKRFDEQDELMTVGISNGDDVYELPYIYFTFWPALKKTNTLEIADGGILFDQEWTGLVLPYEAVNEMKSIDEQKSLIMNFLSTSFNTVQRAFGKR